MLNVCSRSAAEKTRFRSLFHACDRAHLATILAALFLVVSAVPVLAAERPGGPTEEIPSPPTPADFDPSKLPGGADVSEAIEKAERRDEQRRTWLESSEAARQREESRLAFADVDQATARDLLKTVFAEQLAQLNQDPGRFLSDAQLMSTSDATSATVKDEGDGQVLESSLPVRTEDEEGDLRKVDLSLEETAGGFETANALVEVQIPDSAGQPVEVGQDGIAIKLAGADGERTLRPFGDENVLATEVLPDTDMLISPIATGIEVFNVLRSERSPETLRFRVDMPAGAVLRAKGEWGAEVVKDEELLTTIHEPVAVDAQGTDVPVELRVEDDFLALTVDHREGDYAMPILLDPVLENNENWIYGQNHNALDLGVWGFHRNVAGIYGSTYCIYECFGPGGAGTRGLYVSSQPGTYWPGQFAQWSYAAPNIYSYVTGVTLGAPYVRADHGCSSPPYGQPHDYFGIWNGGWVYLSVGSANYPGGHYTLDSNGEVVVFGLGTGGSQFSIGCWRDLYAGGAHVWLDDDYYPSVSRATDPPTHWINSTTPIHVVAQASDPGLGVQNVHINTDGNGSIPDIATQDQCAGTRRSPCLNGHTASFDITGASFGEGRRVASVTAKDATGKYSEAYYFETKIDATAPAVKLDGQLAEATNEVGTEEKPPGTGDQLRLPVYNLKIEATDGDPNSAEKDWRSGVKEIEIWLDGVQQTVPWSPASSCAHSCPMTQTYTLKLTELASAGAHKLKVKVSDFAGNFRQRDIEFEYFPATGMKDEYVMHYFPLDDGSGSEATEEHPDRPELAVNVMNGNLVYREQDVEVEGAAVDLEVERYYNSMLPASENTEWGDGWTLAETPELDPVKTGGSSVPNKADLLQASGALESDLNLPTEAGAEKFNPALQATVTKTAAGGYELTDETGESATTVAFDATGQAEALLTEGAPKVDYTYQEGELSEIEVEDPATFELANPSELPVPEVPTITAPAYVSAFGSAGSGDGQFKVAADVAIDPTDGTIWVADDENNRIQHFDAAGSYLGKFASCHDPGAVEVDSKGDVYVACSSGQQVKKFNDNGETLKSIAGYGSANGQVTSPLDLAVDSSGNLWVADTGNDRLQKFDPTGAFVKAIPLGGLANPWGIDAAASGNVWVAEAGHHRVSLYDSEGELLERFGSQGTGEGQFQHPADVEVDFRGYVWVADAVNDRVQIFDRGGEYLTEFGAHGTGPGQLDTDWWLRLAVGSDGDVWVVDQGNSRVQKWRASGFAPTYAASYGSSGTGDGQFDLPGDVAIDPEGDLWVLDTAHHRVQQLDSSGSFKSKFGSLGSANGQLNRPSAIAIDAQGNVWVADAGNHRIQKFNQAGQYMTKLGSYGTAEGKLASPEGLAIDAKGSIWVSDTANDRVQKFSPWGFVMKVLGSGGQLDEPLGIDVAPAGEVFVADAKRDRVVVFGEAGEYLRAFGSSGSGDGQLRNPTGLEVDGRRAWVLDDDNQRVQQFDLQGNYVTQFGAAGSGAGQFSFALPAGVATDPQGGVWVSDSGNDRVQRWEIPGFVAPAEVELTDADPKVEVETESELVSSVEGQAAGEHAYTHSGDDLVAHSGPEGESRYEYDSGRMTEVTLPNGTWASIAYFPDARVKSVTVDPAGAAAAKTTHFAYSDEPRRSTVTPPEAPHITYDIGWDGSVLKWWNTLKPPTIEPLMGSLYDNRETQGPISAGDYILTARAWSAEGIASIDIVVNGNQLVDEKSCAQNFETTAIECEEDVNQWVMETGEHAPGILQVEVVVTDHAKSNKSTAAERFWVNIPRTPPPLPGVPTPPKFKEIKDFREDYGLEVVFPVADEIELNERIFNLIGAWHNPSSPVGQVARASWERWGVPLRAEDVAELEYREQYLSHNGPLIRTWGEQHAPSTYAGFYMDHRAGGKVRVGFTGDAGSALASLKATTALHAVDRVGPFIIAPSHALSGLAGAFDSVGPSLEAQPGVSGKLTRIGVDIERNTVRVHTTDVAAVSSAVGATFGSGAPITVLYDSGQSQPLSRFRASGPVLAGDHLAGKEFDCETSPDGKCRRRCSAGFGAAERKFNKSVQRHVVRSFTLATGHCWELGDSVFRQAGSKEGPAKPYGDVKRSSFLHIQAGAFTDGLAIEPRSDGLVPRRIYRDPHSQAVSGLASGDQGRRVCFSGWGTDEERGEKGTCGEIAGPPEEIYYGDRSKPTFLVPVNADSSKGDSGGPVWLAKSGLAVGLNAYGGAGNMWYAPLVRPEATSAAKAPGILNAPGMGDLYLLTDN
jgi:tripartite motif-containing protein 71